MTYTVTALRLGSIEVDKSGLVYGTPPGTRIEIPVWGAAIEGHGCRIIVDTGFIDQVKWSAYNPCRQQPDETIDAALAEMGWRRRDVDIVINSHLHYDHSENNPGFGNARFFVSHAEWIHAHHPVESQAWSYDCEWVGPDVNVLDYTLVGIDHYDVLPGLRLIQTPGHTPGHQSVLVDTDSGILCIAGDAACLMENFETPVATGVTVSEEQSLNSLRKIAENAQLVLMNHDPQLTAFQSDNFPVVGASVPFLDSTADRN